ncbi:MAG: hypothetical protein HY364_00050 [Candidatus Aenigmarchaeota archaeon]|nr:hypothetical protein [Candidatus Aenigmarchaeota archaeon]
MPTPAENARAFVTIWNTRFPLLNMGGAVIYGGSQHDIERRGNNEYVAGLLGRLEETLKGAYVTASCSEYLSETARRSFRIGMPPSMRVPLYALDIDEANARYGIFSNDTENLAAIETELLEVQEEATRELEMMALLGFTTPNDMKYLNQRWRAEFGEKYGLKNK